MCTITYLPGHEGTFTLTQNRDVSPTRSSDGLKKVERPAEIIIYPQDSWAGGTWTAISNQDRCLCVMNGAFYSHISSPPYRMSRGLLALQLFEFPSAKIFFEEVDLHGIEPFTMISLDQGSLHEFRWDLKNKHVLMLDPRSPHIWASSTLYDEQWQAARREWFKHWLSESPQPSEEKILQFHKEGGNGDPENDMIMKRSDQVQTVGISQIRRDLKQLHIRYEDLVSGEVEQGMLDLEFS